MRLRAIHLHVFKPTDIHHRKVGTQAATNGLIGTVGFRLEQLQPQHHPRGYRGLAPGMLLGETTGKTRFDGADHRRPGKRIRPLAQRMRRGYKVGNRDSLPPIG